MKPLFATTVFIFLCSFSMEMQAQNFKRIDAGELTLEVFHASEASFGVASVLVSGKTDAVLIDAQFTLADAETVARKIQQSGKKLTAIYVSHGDPDFYFGLEVFKRSFPEVTVYASPATIAHIKATAQKKLDVWGGRLGKALTSNVVLPQVLPGTGLELEGHRLEIIGLDKFPERTFVWIPAARTVVGGINVFGNTFHLWMADAQTPEARQEWRTVLAAITALQPTTVVPAHAGEGAALDLLSVQHTDAYLQFYEQALHPGATSEALISALKAKYPTLTFDIALQIGAKVNTGEMKW